MAESKFSLRIPRKYDKRIFAVVSISVILSILGPFSVYLLQAVVKTVETTELTTIAVLLSFFVITKILNMLGEPVVQYLSKQCTICISNDLRRDYIKGMQTISYEAYNGIKGVELIDKINILDQYANGLINPVLSLCSMVPSLLTAVIFLFLLDPVLILWVMVPIPIWVLCVFGLNKALKKLRLKSSKTNSQILDFIAAFVEGIENILTFRMFWPTIQIYRGVEKKRIQFSMKEAACSTLRKDANELLQQFVVAIIFINASFHFSLDVASLVAVFYLTPYIYQPLFSGSEIVDQVLDLRVQKQRLMETINLFDTEDKPRPPFDSISLKDVSYHFPGQSKNQLENISLQFDKPGCIILVGESGEGKSTLVDVMLGLRSPNHGTVEFRSSQKQQSTKGNHQYISFQKQNPTAFSMSVYDNITMGKVVPVEKIISVCKKLNIYDEIEALPNGFDTLLGEKGQNLSGGQMQRIALARTIIQDTYIMVFDEPTSALDVTNEQFFIDFVNELRKEHLIIIITHRESLLQAADAVYRVVNGTVVPVLEVTVN